MVDTAVDSADFVDICSFLEMARGMAENYKCIVNENNVALQYYWDSRDEAF